MQLREEEVAQIPVVLIPKVIGVDRDGALENAPELKQVPLDYMFGLRWMPVGVHLSKFLIDGAKRIQAPVLPLLLRLAAIGVCAATICVCAAIISGGILGGTISGVIPDATRGCVVRIGVFRGVLIAVRLLLQLLGQLPELLAA